MIGLFGILANKRLKKNISLGISSALACISFLLLCGNLFTPYQYISFPIITFSITSLMARKIPSEASYD